MDIGHLLPPSCVVGNLKAADKKDLLRQLAHAASPSLSLDAQTVFEALWQRERLGTTGLGHGVAIPHARIAGLETISGFFIRLQEPVDFQSMDQEPVDLVFAIFAPADAGADHLDALLLASRIFRDTELTEKLRKARDAGSLHALLAKQPRQHAA